MNETRDPTRWIEGGEQAPEGFDVLVRADEAQGPSATELTRMLDGLSRQLARPELAGAFRAQPQPPAAGAAAAPASSGAAPLGLFGKLGVGLAVLGLAAAGAWLVRSPAPRPRSASTPAVVRQAPAPSGAAAVPAARVPEPAPAAVPLEEAVPRAPTPARARSAAVADDPAGELLLLERAQRALRGDPGGAFVLAEQHRRRFARGQFEQEREMLAIEALLRLGREPEARRRAQRFEQRHARSSHLPRLHDLLRSKP